VANRFTRARLLAGTSKTIITVFAKAGVIVRSKQVGYGRKLVRGFGRLSLDFLYIVYIRGQ
jgi:hypothetical protein